jgi:hypothetical protein
MHAQQQDDVKLQVLARRRTESALEDVAHSLAFTLEIIERAGRDTALRQAVAAALRDRIEHPSLDEKPIVSSLPEAQRAVDFAPRAAAEARTESDAGPQPHRAA